MAKLLGLIKLVWDGVTGLCFLAGIVILCLSGYQLIFGPSLKPNSTYRETRTFLGKEIDSHVFQTDSAEVIHQRIVKFTMLGAGLIATGVALVFLPRLVMKAILLGVRARLRAKYSDKPSGPMTDDQVREFVLQIPGAAEENRKVAKDVFGIELDYSAESVGKLDDMVEEGWPNGPPTLLEEVVMGFGSYLGETIRHLHGGDWCYSPDKGIHLEVGNTGIKVFPFSKVRKRFLNGEEDSLGFYYSFLRSEVEKAGKVA